MSVDIWFKEDIRNILLSANASSAATAQCAPGPAVHLYRRGYQAALLAVALAFGIAPDQLGIKADASQGGFVDSVETLRLKAG